MKRITLTLLLLAPVALAGCQTIKAHNPFRHKEPPYQAAQQGRPLEVPPGMDQPATTDALVIPDAGTGAAASAPSAQTGIGVPPAAGAAAPPAGAAGNGMTLSDTPDSAYHRVGLALARGDVGQVTAHDDAAHTYQVAVDAVGGSTVTVSVAASGSGSTVTAQGDPDAVTRVMGILRQRLGGG
ncbi:MAG TPA: hypothetical protein VFY97_02595 [Rhodanobacteraceae bacterium]|nr:hypothetical protein [Rhodanobacteraceae bacterium]